MKCFRRLVLVLVATAATAAAQTAPVGVCPSGADREHPCCAAPAPERAPVGTCCSGMTPERDELGAAGCTCRQHGSRPPAVTPDRLPSPDGNALDEAAGDAARVEGEPSPRATGRTAPEPRCPTGSGSPLYLETCALLI